MGFQADRTAISGKEQKPGGSLCERDLEKQAPVLSAERHSPPVESTDRNRSVRRGSLAEYRSGSCPGHAQSLYSEITEDLERSFDRFIIGKLNAFSPGVSRVHPLLSVEAFQAQGWVSLNSLIRGS